MLLLYVISYLFALQVILILTLISDLFLNVLHNTIKLKKSMLYYL